MSECGTYAGAKAHYRAREPLCADCRASERERSREYRSRNSPGADMTPPQRRALANLMDADGYNQRPCHDAVAWDLPRMPNARRVSARDEYDEQVADRRRRCQVECPVLAACEAYAATGPRVIGVLAGLTDEDRRTARKTA